jgi:hypothetical protein
VDNAVRGIDHEDTKQHRHSIWAWRADGGNESEDPNRQKDNTKKHSECFNHCETACRFKTLRLWQLVSLAGKIKRGISQRVFDEIV